MRPLAGAAVGLSVILGLAIESTHAHSASDLSAVCSVCKLPNLDAPASAPETPVVAGSDLVSAPRLSGRRLVSAIVHLSPHRSRAPPLPISPQP